MAKTNPFKPSFVRLQIPAHMGGSVSVAGFNLEADDENCVEVPSEVAPLLIPHGLTPVQPKEAAAA